MSHDPAPSSSTIRPDDRDPIDRVSPTLRPPRRALMRQDWHHLLFLHWVVPAEALRRIVPDGLELDLFDGRAYVGLIPFTMTGVRPAWTPPIPGLSDSHETNVRTYVHRDGRDPGVWFFSLDAASRLAVLGARLFFHLPYFHARMRVTTEPETGAISYNSQRLRPGPTPANHAIVGTPFGNPTTAQVGTLDHFLIERYILYTTHRGRLYHGQIHHQSYPLQSASVSALDETMIAAAGISRPDTPPIVHYAREVNVEVFGLSRLT